MELASLPPLLEGDSSPCPSAKPLPGPEGLLFITNRGQWAGMISGVPVQEPCSPCCMGTQRALHPGDCHCSPRPDPMLVATHVSSPSDSGCVRSGRNSPASLGGQHVSTAGSWAHFSSRGRAKQPAARGPCRLNPGSASPVPVMHGELCPCRSPGEGRGGDGEWCWARSLLCLLAALGCSAGRVSRGDVQVLDVQVLWLGAAGQPLLLHHLRVQQQDMRSGRALQSSGHSFWLFGCVATEYKTQTETPPASFAPAREMVLWGCWAAASQAHGCCGLHPSYPVLSVLMRPAQT